MLLTDVDYTELVNRVQTRVRQLVSQNPRALAALRRACANNFELWDSKPPEGVAWFYTRLGLEVINITELSPAAVRLTDKVRLQLIWPHADPQQVVTYEGELNQDFELKRKELHVTHG